MSDLLRWGNPGFPEPGLLRSRAGDGLALLLRYSGPVALGVAALSLAASAVLTVGLIRAERLATSEAAAARDAEHANVDLQDALARLRDELGTANQTLAATQSRISVLSDEAHRQQAVSEQAATSRADRVALLSRALEQAQRELHLAEAQRATLVARLSKSESDLAEGRARQQQAQTGLDQWQKKIQQLTADRDRAAAERDQLRAKITELQQRLSMKASRGQAVAAAAPSLPGAAPAPAAVARAGQAPAQPAANAPVAAAASRPVAAVAVASPRPLAAPAAVAAVNRGGLAQVERVLASTGVDVHRIFAQFGADRGVGGPVVPVPRGGVPTLSAQKLAALSQIVNTLPVSAPLDSYRVGSPFGVRGDPMNEHREFHTGMDFDAPYMSPVYATAPGVVTYAGYRDDYGKVVEIDHGHGISTRYAHLHRFIVAVGQRVASRQQIGFLGSTGRATGPHVHYEVLVNGEPQDPEKFLGLARLVRVAQH